MAVVSVLILAGLAIWNELATRGDLAQANRESIEANQFAQRNLRNAEVIEAMGMLPRLRGRWQEKQLNMLALQGQSSAKAGLINALVKTYRLTIQSLVLGLGAYLAIHKEITPGLVIAGSILLGRALAPLDLMIGSWKGFLSARESYRRLNQLLAEIPSRQPPMRLLDEPNSNLDQAGDAAFLATLANLQQAGRTVIVITHRPNVLNQVDKILMLVEGQVALYGPRDEVLKALAQAQQKAQASLPQAAQRPAGVAPIRPIPSPPQS